MKRDCPNAKRVMLTQDEEKADDSSSEKEADDNNVDVYPEDVAPNCRNLMVQRVSQDRLEGQG